MISDDTSSYERFLETYDRLGDAVYRFALMWLSNRDAALDTTQEAFMRYWEYLRAGKEVTNERALIFTIARRLIIDQYRARKNVSLDHLTEEHGFEIRDEKLPLPDEVSEGARALALLGELPEPYQETLFLRFVEGLEPREIATTLGVSANVISVRLHRGIEQLRARMHTEHHE